MCRRPCADARLVLTKPLVFQVYVHSSEVVDRHAKLKALLEEQARSGEPLCILATHSVVVADLQAHRTGRAQSPFFSDVFDLPCVTKLLCDSSRTAVDTEALRTLYRSAPCRWSGILLDESHVMRNESTLGWKAVVLLSSQVHRAHGFQMNKSGTPFHNQDADLRAQLRVSSHFVLAHPHLLEVTPSNATLVSLFRKVMIEMPAKPKSGGYPDLEIHVKPVGAPQGLAHAKLVGLQDKASKLLGLIESQGTGGKQKSQATIQLFAVLTRMRIVTASGAAAFVGFPREYPDAALLCAMCPHTRLEDEEDPDASPLCDGSVATRKRPRPVSRAPCGHGRCDACRQQDRSSQCGCAACHHIEQVRLENQSLGAVPVMSSTLTAEEKAVLASSPQRSAFYTEKHVLMATRLRELISQRDDDLRANERPDKTLFVFSFRISMKCFEQFLRDIGWQDDLKRCEEISGAVLDRRMRVRAQERINERSCEYVACFLTPTTGGVGLNLQGANQVIFVDTLWNSALVEQVVCRAWRLGQTRTVSVWYLMARSAGTLASIEESMAMLCRRKEQDGDNILGGKAPLSSSQAKKMVAKMVVGRGSDASSSFLRPGEVPRLKHGTFFQLEPPAVAPAQSGARPPADKGPPPSRSSGASSSVAPSRGRGGGARPQGHTTVRQRLANRMRIMQRKRG